jgi:hypothetical protein
MRVEGLVPPFSPSRRRTPSLLPMRLGLRVGVFVAEVIPPGMSQ